MKRIFIFLIVLMVASIAGIAIAADVVPTEIEQPGTQPGEVGNLESPDKCDNCHGGYNTSVEPAFNWRGSMMANAGRDPIFWATLAIAEQDFDGAGDLCIRCHSSGGWYAGRSTPTDGSGLAVGDADGVDCDTCHKMTNPNNQEWLGVMNAPFTANDGAGTGYYGSGILSLWGGSDKLGPYSDATARHQFMQSDFHRSQDFCGSCHDVSNPAVGDLAHNNGAQSTGDPVTASGVPGSPVEEKAAFNNFPYQYGVVERTYSEFYSGALSTTLVSSYDTLPADLQAGAIEAVYNAAGGDYADGTNRYFTCQTCHMRAVTGPGCNKKGAPIRTDLPLHDLTGGNYWMPDAIQYQDSLGLLRLGGGLTDVQIAALNAGKERARQQLNLAASLEVNGDTLKITNLTGHKLISGYPEGRRMWLNIKWYDDSGALVREDGAYGDIAVEINGSAAQVRTLLDLHDPNTKIYEAHYGMTQEWAAQLISLGYPGGLPLSYDRETGLVTLTLGQLATQAAGTDAETFHFVLNNAVIKDNRIPPYNFDYEEARKRNALPVPANQYGGTPGGTYDYWDDFALNPPAGATNAQINLMYQPTSWEYVQFLYLANTRQNAFLADEGINMLDTWLHTGMAEPQVMATASWGSAPQVCNAPAPTLLSATPGNQQVVLEWSDENAIDAGVTGYKVFYDQSGKSQLITQVEDVTTTFTDTAVSNGNEYCYMVTSLYDTDGDNVADCESGFSNIVCAIPNNQGQALVSVTLLETGIYSGKRNNKTFTPQTLFAAGDQIFIQATVVDENTGQPIPNATVEITISGPESIILTTGSSDSAGIAEASWSTLKPKGNQPGTALGGFTATVTNVTAAGYHWDGIPTSTNFTIE